MDMFSTLHGSRHAVRTLSVGLAVALSSIVASGDAGKTEAPLQGGFELRARNEYFDNALTLNDTATRHEQNYQRIRTRLWARVAPIESLELKARLAWESWNWNKPSYKAPYAEGWVWSEGVFDQFALVWTNDATMPWTITVGRQDINLGDNWLVADASTTDGSRTAFFDAARATINFATAKTTLDLAIIDLDADLDARLPVLNNQHKEIVEQDERSLIVWLTNRSLEGFEISGYLLHRDTTPVLSSGIKTRYSTFGARVVADMGEHVRVKADVAWQTGKRSDRDLRAWGTTGQVAWLVKDPAKNQLTFSWEALSGDDPDTAEDEQFDIVWGRFPRWSEIAAMLYAVETRGAEFGNLVRIGPGWSCSPAAKLDLSIDYNLLWALQNNRSNTSWFSSDGSYRGDLFRAVGKYRFNAHLTATLLAEYFRPGDYYAQVRQDAATFVRAELSVVF